MMGFQVRNLQTSRYFIFRWTMLNFRGVSGCFRKWWYPQIIHFNKVFHYKPSILGYPYFWKHPCIYSNTFSLHRFSILGLHPRSGCNGPSWRPLRSGQTRWAGQTAKSLSFGPSLRENFPQANRLYEISLIIARFFFGWEFLLLFFVDPIYSHEHGRFWA